VPLGFLDLKFKQNMKTHRNSQSGSWGGGSGRVLHWLLVLLLIAGYTELRGYFLTQQLGGRISESEQRISAGLASTSNQLTTTAADLDAKISVILGQSNTLSSVLNEQQTKTQMVEEKIGSVVSTVGTLDRLSKTDPELLQKYSKVFFLNEHYVPPKLSDINSEFIYDKNRKLQIHAQVWPYLEKMLRDANNGATPAGEKANLLVASAYRSFGTQASLKAAYRVTYGAGTANSFSADQGYSEHQLGTTVDLTTPQTGGELTGFEKTSAYSWLQNNAYKYGFVLSYPENNKYYVFEPWHWRFVGVDLANKLHREGKGFYDMDQRDIDNYLFVIFG
jgi:LAS superfamily LD-carboxypeptidase LdcB